MVTKREIKKGWIKVSAEMDRLGSVIMRPVSDKYAEKFAAVVAEFTGNSIDDEKTVYVQDGFGLDALHNADLIPRRLWKDLDAGWTIHFLADPWIFAHYYGYDAHCIVESGELWK